MRSKRTYSLGSVPGDVARVWEQPKQYVPPIWITTPELSAGLSETPLKDYRPRVLRVFREMAKSGSIIFTIWGPKML